jgi:hypothetical protein
MDFRDWSEAVLREMRSLGRVAVGQSAPVLDCKPLWERGLEPRAAAMAMLGLDRQLYDELAALSKGASA